MAKDTTALPYRLIPLRGKYGEGKFAKVDPEDFDELSQFTWRANPSGYAIRSVWSKNYFMHRDIAQPPEGMLTDHINGDTLDNRRCNLRLCLHAENMRNRRIGSKGSSQYKGVSRSKYEGRWQAIIGADKRSFNCGTYDSEEAAARAYDSAAVHFFGEFARTNFSGATPVSPADLRKACPKRNRWDGKRKSHA